MERFKFEDLFVIGESGSMTPKVPIRIGGIVFGKYVTFNEGLVIQGVNLFFYKKLNIDILAVMDNLGVLDIVGFAIPIDRNEDYNDRMNILSECSNICPSCGHKW